MSNPPRRNVVLCAGAILFAILVFLGADGADIAYVAMGVTLGAAGAAYMAGEPE